MRVFQVRRSVIAIFSFIALIVAVVINSPVQVQVAKTAEVKGVNTSNILAKDTLNKLQISNTKPTEEYSRDKFGSGWQTVTGCDTRNIILNRDLVDVVIDGKCNVLSGVLLDPYTGKSIIFKRGSATSAAIQIDHVVALSNAWVTGAYLLTLEERRKLANDPLELLAVDGPSNQQKSDGDAASWLPSNKPFRCQYVARQIAIKQKYKLWLAKLEYQVMQEVLRKCPNQMLPSP